MYGGPLPTGVSKGANSRNFYRNKSPCLAMDSKSIVKSKPLCFGMCVVKTKNFKDKFNQVNNVQCKKRSSLLLLVFIGTYSIAAKKNQFNIIIKYNALTYFDYIKVNDNV